MEGGNLPRTRDVKEEEAGGRREAVNAGVGVDITMPEGICEALCVCVCVCVCVCLIMLVVSHSVRGASPWLFSPQRSSAGT